MSKLIDASRLTDPAFPIEDYPGTNWPKVATVRELDLKFDDPTDPTRLDIYFSRAEHSIDISQLPNGLQSLLDTINAGTLAFNDDPKPKGKYKSPLSLKNGKLSYIVYVLSNKNWQFAHNRPPFSIGQQAKAADAYFHARTVSPNGAIIPPTARQNGCRIAYMISDGHKSSGSGAKKDYEHAININVDLMYLDSDGNDSPMPITIDPDIRFPGGSG